MNLNKIVCLVAAIGLVEAKPYTGLLLSGSFLNSKGNFSGTDEDTPTTTFSFNKDIKKSLNTIGGGVLFGYKVETSGEIVPYFEGDVIVTSGTIKTVDNNNANNGTLDETFELTKGVEFGFTPGVSIPLTDKLDLSLGLRANIAQYKVSVVSALSRSNATKKYWVFGVEPNVGGTFKVSEKIAVRGSIGYNFAQKKKLANYVDATHAPVQASYSFQPNGVNARLALIWNFG